MENFNEIEKLRKEIQEIKERNNKVEQDKAWETSWTRKIAVAIVTYVVIVLFFSVSKLGNPWINAVVPTL